MLATRSLALLCAALSLQAAPPRSAKPARTEKSATPVSPALRGMSLRDRIAQMIVVRGYGDYPTTNNTEYRHFLHWIQDDHVGGFIVAGHIRNGSVVLAQPFELAAFVNHMQRLSRTPLLVASDFERGASMRVADTPRYPYLMAFGAAHDPGFSKALGMATAHEARSLGINWVFAPDADVNNNPDNPIINTRSFGEDPKAVADGVSAFIEGAHARPDEYVLLAAKHFPGHGDTAQDSHMQMAVVNQPRERLESVEFVPFRAAIKANIDAVMTAHLSVPSIDTESRPATLSPNVLTGLLRNELGFGGLVVTDALEMQGITSRYSSGDASVRAVEAGADVLLMPPDPDASIKAIAQAVASGRISQARINQSAARILAAKRRVGLYRSRTINLDTLSAQLEAPANEELAQRVAERAITLVKDERHLIPLAPGGNACLAILGESQFTQRGEALVSELHRLHRDLKTYLATPYIPEKVLDAMATDATQCSAVYVAAFITVSANRGSVGLEGGLAHFLKALTDSPIPVALLSFGNPYLIRDFPKATAYAATFSTTSTSEVAAARAIAGTIPISGRLPVSIPGISHIGEGISLPAGAFSTPVSPAETTASNGAK